MKKYHTSYALYNMSIDDLEIEIEWAAPVMVTNDPREITAQVGGCENDDKKWCVEIFIADENDEFVSGSDFDNITHFYKQVEEGYYD